MELVLCASFNYIDIAIVVVAALFLLIGLAIGFSRSLRGFPNFILVLVLSLTVAAYASNALVNSSLGDKLNGALESSCESSWGEAFNVNLRMDGDTLMAVADDNTEKPFSELDTNAVVKFIVAKFAVKVVSEEGGLTLGQIIVPNITALIMTVCLLVLTFIVLKLLFMIIRNLWYRVIDNEDPRDASSSSKGLDRILGLLIWAVYAVALVFFVLGIFGTLEDKAWMSSVIAQINDSMITKAIYDINPIREVLVKIFLPKI